MSQPTKEKSKAAPSKNGGKAPKLPNFLVGVVNARQEETGWVIVGANGPVSLALFIGQIANSKGEWRSLGMVYNPLPGATGMELAIYYCIPQDSEAAKALGLTAAAKVGDEKPA